jgi:GTP-binding protein HflX
MYTESASIQRETAIVISVGRKGEDRAAVREHLEELVFLAQTAQVHVAETMIQERVSPDVATYIGKGKVQELKELVEQHGAHVVLADDELSPVQIRNLERELNVKVLDRSALILDIFATRARSVEAKTQVELAQLQYLMPRLSRMWTHLSKQYGGVGTKGPGETQIESDRRMIRYRIQRLKEKLREIDVQRKEQRKQRGALTRFALIGYTNAGKSTLMNVMTNAEVYTEDQLFATLDTTVRQIELPQGTTALLSDTVGFIRKLPTHLIASFRSTLAESMEADMLIHVVDVSHPAFQEHMAVVDETLRALHAEEKPIVVVFNKIDAVEDKDLLQSYTRSYPDALFISAKKGLNVRALVQRMQEFCDSFAAPLELHIPFSAMNKVAALYTQTEVVERRDDDDGVFLKVHVAPSQQGWVQSVFAEYIRSGKQPAVSDEHS